jgi:hypothetical protein
MSASLICVSGNAGAAAGPRSVCTAGVAALVFRHARRVDKERELPTRRGGVKRQFSAVQTDKIARGRQLKDSILGAPVVFEGSQQAIQRWGQRRGPRELDAEPHPLGAGLKYQTHSRPLGEGCRIEQQGASCKVSWLAWAGLPATGADNAADLPAGQQALTRKGRTARSGMLAQLGGQVGPPYTG